MSEKSIVVMDTSEFFQKMEELLKKHHISTSPDDFVWLDTNTVMKMLAIKSPTTLLKLRNNGSIRYTQVGSRKQLLYDRRSIEDYLEKNARDTF